MPKKSCLKIPLSHKSEATQNLPENSIFHESEAVKKLA
jgi:hypothetical protein